MSNGAIVQVQDMPLARPPEEVLADAQKAAQALQNVVANKKKKVIINGEQYLEFEDWQTLGKFYRVQVRTHDAEPIEVFGELGFKAKADVIDMTTGQIIGGAEAFCLRNEKNWDDKPFFQLASMAQTRAGAKALRNVLAWVAVLAGYRPTPAEEMTGQEKPSEQIDEPVSEKQRNRFYAIAKGKGYTDNQMKAWMKEKYKIESTKDIKKSYYEELCYDFEKELVPKK